MKPIEITKQGQFGCERTFVIRRALRRLNDSGPVVVEVTAVICSLPSLSNITH